MDDTNRCVCCGAIIPEGLWACPTCEKETCVHLWQFERFTNNEIGENCILWKCDHCGKERMAATYIRSWA